MTLVSKESLQQAQALLTLQQQQLQVAGLLGTGMPNLAGLTQAAALAAGLTPALLAQTGLKPSDLPNLIGDKPADKDNSKIAPKYEKDKESSKRDDLTRKLMQRMRDKKLKQEEMLPAFQTRKDKPVEGTDKIFTGSGLKSRKIEISSSFGKLWTKVDGSPKFDDGTRDFGEANEEDDLTNSERTGSQEQENKVSSWSAQQAKLKEEAKREMREQIERAERAKKEKMKEEILENERQHEIMRIREEVRSQIRKEIQDEIAKQRKSVLEDPNVREKLIQLEALRNQSGMLSANNAGGNLPVSSMPVTVSNSSPMPMPSSVKDQRWYQQQMKNKQDMQKWMESHGYFASDIDENTLKRLQMTYMQNWTPGQRQAYMQWYWQGKQYREPGHYRPQFGVTGQRPSAIPQSHPGATGPNSHAMDVHKPSPGPLAHRMPVSQLSEQHGIVPISGRPMPFPQRLPYSTDNVPRPRHPLPPRITAYNDHQFHDEPSPSQFRDMDGQPFAYDRFAGREPGATNLMQHAPTETNFHHLRPGEGNAQMNHEQIKAMNHPEAIITAQEIGNHPIHQYPPPCLEDEEGSEKKMPQSTGVSDQPPPPGELAAVVTDRPIGTYAPPGSLSVANDGETVSKSKKKKRKKKHKRKKYSSSDDEGEEDDPEAEKAAILAKLRNLPDVEDGEIASDADDGEVKATKKRKKAKKEKKKHKKRISDSDDGARLAAHPSSTQLVGAPHVSETMFHSSAPVVMPHEMNITPIYRGPHEHYANQELPTDHKLLPPHRDHGGAGEPQPVLLYPRHQKPPMGPGGDHSHTHRKRTPSPLPLVIPNDPMEYELWQRKMQARYQKDLGHGVNNPIGGRGLNRQFLAHVDRVRERQNDREPIDGVNDDVVAMMRMMEDEQRRRDQSPLLRGRPMREDRKRRSALPHRGRRKQRRMMPRRNYHDWDKPEDDGLIYCHSGSESSGWGSDTNLNFDKMLAKKQKEAEKDRARLPPPIHGREQSPGRVGWDRREMSHNEDMMIPPAEKPQGIPVIGGGPRPIPTNVSMSRGPRRDMVGPLDFPTSHDIVKMPPAMAPIGYPQDSHFDQRREQTFIPPPIPVVSHPIPRLGSQGVPSLPPPPPIMMNPNSQRLHPMNYGKQRFSM